ncbi:Pr6Pr family membrane protein [Herbiconiux sp. P15]|uniref:Pr6Pr family membrane protein n=1 Tax=Herbiconiux liukaitaii TaxID=3342799 RepID=UPI0035BAF333
MISTGTQRAVGIARLVIALIGAVALVFDFDYVLGFSTFSTINYFSYFTFQSNLLNVLVLALAGVLLLRGREVNRLLLNVRAATICYVVVSGIVFGLIVSQAGSHNYRIEVPWPSQVLHFYLPPLVVADWLFGVGRRRLRWRSVAVVLVFPVVWGVFTLLRGAEVGWYPYFFLDPAQVSGPLEFALYSGIALGLFAGLMALLVLISRRRPWAESWGRASTSPPDPRKARASGAPLRGTPGRSA